MKKEPIVEIFTDGACRGNPGIGGWGALLRLGETEKKFYGAETYTTNNRMELMAAIMALTALKRTSQVKLTTDSEYLRKGITEWIHGWKINGWKTKQRKPIKNQDLWQRLDELVQQHQVEWFWVRGHTGHAENELADALARHAIDELLEKE